MSQRVMEAEDRLYVIDGSRSMNDRLGREKMSKIGAVKRILVDFCMERWPASYYPWPLRIGVTTYRLLGTPGETVFDEVIPLNPEPISLEIWRLQKMAGKGGAIIRDALLRAQAIMSESPRGKKGIVLVGDGGDSGTDPSDVAGELGKSGVGLTCVELGNESTHSMRVVAKEAGGRYQLAKTYEDVKRLMV